MSTEPSCGTGTGTDTVAKLKRRMAYRAANLLDPRYADSRRFPNWCEGMTTADYLLAYAVLNVWRNLKALPFVHADRVAPYNVVEVLA